MEGDKQIVMNAGRKGYKGGRKQQKATVEKYNVNTIWLLIYEGVCVSVYNTQMAKL